VIEIRDFCKALMRTLRHRRLLHLWLTLL